MLMHIIINAAFDQKNKSDPKTLNLTLNIFAEFLYLIQSLIQRIPTSGNIRSGQKKSLEVEMVDYTSLTSQVVDKPLDLTNTKYLSKCKHAKVYHLLNYMFPVYIYIYIYIMMFDLYSTTFIQLS